MGPAGPQGEPGSTGETPDLSALEARVNELEQKVAALSPTPTPTPEPTPTPVPTPTPIPTLCDDKPLQPAGLWFSELNCTGQAFLQHGEENQIYKLHFSTPVGKWCVQAHEFVGAVQVKSVLNETACRNEQQVAEPLWRGEFID